jgi:alkaline phosphatase D
MALVWTLPGVPGADRLRASAALDAVGDIQLAVSEDSNMTNPILGNAVTVEASKGFRAPVEVSGLKDDTLYYWRINTGGSLQGGGEMRTGSIPPKSFKFASSSCDRDWFINGAIDLFNEMEANDYDLFLHLGDWHYEDISVNTDQLFYDAWDTRLVGSANAANLAARNSFWSQIALSYMWDDHDFGPNNSNASSPSKEAAYRSIRQNFAAPYVNPENTKAPYYSYTYHGLRFIHTDQRSTFIPGNTAIGAEQEAWFKAELLDAKDKKQPIIWITTSPWNSTRADAWNGVSAEQNALNTWFTDNGVAEYMIVISGDAHMCALDDGTNTAFGNGDGLVTVQSAAITTGGSFKGGEWSHGFFTGNPHYGAYDVDYKGDGKWDITITGNNAETDTEYFSYVHSMDYGGAPDTELVDASAFKLVNGILVPKVELVNTANGLVNKKVIQ